MWRDRHFNIENGELPFSFIYKGESSADFIKTWEREIRCSRYGGYTLYTVTYTEPGADTKLKVTAEVKLYDELPASDWRLYMENAGAVNTGIVEAVDSIALQLPVTGRGYLLRKSYGGLSTDYDFVQDNDFIFYGRSRTIRTYGGRSTNDSNAYFTLDCDEGRLMAAIGWSGQWKCTFDYRPDGLHVEGGLEDCRFALYPGEKLELPSIVALFCENDTDRACSLFRRLILDYYVPEKAGRDKSPYLFCNTCFTRGGLWLDECNAENQISLIKALNRLDVESVITDAGWYPGGWSGSVGNWYPDPERYPGGIEPVAAAAAEKGMSYGLWFELERVSSTSKFAKEHPEMMLCNRNLHDNSGAYQIYLANLGDPAVVDYLYSIDHNN